MTQLSFSVVVYRHRYVSFLGSVRGVMVMVVGNGHADTSSNPE